MADCKVFLVPGFFGFTSLGALNYFNRVSQLLRGNLQQRGVDVDIVECPTLPTGSIRNRAERLLEVVVEAGGLTAAALHFVGHSTGGLDCRLLVTPEVRLCPGSQEQLLGERTRSVVTVCTPHFGTPLSSFFTSLQGRNLLQLLTVLATCDAGRRALFLTAQATNALARLDDRLGRRNTLLDALSERLFQGMTVGRDDPIWQFLDEVASDQGAIIQLTPEGMNLFNAAVVDRPGVAYSSLVAAAPSPSLASVRRLGTVGRAALFGVFALIHQLSSREHRHYPYPYPATADVGELERLLDKTVTPQTNDGIVPTLSQVYGTLVDAVVADHLDVVGQFRDAGGQRFADWLPSASRFDESRFERVWKGVAGAIAQAQGGQAPAGTAA